MFPIRDNIKSTGFPFLTVLLIIANFYVFFQQLQLSDAALNKFIHLYGLIPADFAAHLARFPVRPDTYLPLFTNLFLHGGWMHIISNMWYVWIFADNIENRMGHFRFLVFYLLCGIAANLTHVWIDPSSTIPTIGASGAVSGILGAYLVTFPYAKILTLVPIFIFIQFIEIPALIFLGFWFILQLQSGALSLTAAGSNVAWWAHIGGFVAGILLVKLFDRPQKTQWQRR